MWRRERERKGGADGKREEIANNQLCSLNCNKKNIYWVGK